MGTVKVHYDPEGNTLTVWFDDPAKEHLCENVDDEVILIKDRRGHVIGFERFNYFPKNKQKRRTKAKVAVKMM